MNERVPQPKRLPSGESNANVVIRGYRMGAKRRGVEFDLSNESAIQLFTSNCFYCGSAPSSVQHKARSNGPFTYNGMDRIDSSVGYVEGNVVPCCGTCNWMKGSMTLGEFVLQTRRIAERFAAGWGAMPQRIREMAHENIKAMNNVAVAQPRARAKFVSSAKKA